MLPKFSASASTVGALMTQSEIVKDATELRLLPFATPIRKAPSHVLAVQLLTLTVSMLNLLGYPFAVYNRIRDKLLKLQLVTATREMFTRGIALSPHVGRSVDPAQVRAAIAFLASEDASYVTGQTLNVSGGLSMW
jgi:hypothetical protein